MIFDLSGCSRPPVEGYRQARSLCDMLVHSDFLAEKPRLQSTAPKVIIGVAVLQHVP